MVKRKTKKQKRREWKRGVAKHYLALGSWIFYILILILGLIKPYRPFADQIIIAGIFLFLLAFLIRRYDGYSAKGLVLVVFTILLFQDIIYTIFAILVMVGLIFSSYIIGQTKKRIAGGLFIGGICILIAYLLAGYTLLI